MRSVALQISGGAGASGLDATYIVQGQIQTFEKGGHNQTYHRVDVGLAGICTYCHSVRSTWAYEACQH